MEITIKSSLLLAWFVLLALFTQAQDKKLVGSWLLTKVEYQDTTYHRGKENGDRWMEFYNDHTMNHGVYKDQISGKGSWEFSRSNHELTIVFNDSQERTIWYIKKLSSKKLIIGGAYPYLIFRKTSK